MSTQESSLSHVPGPYYDRSAFVGIILSFVLINIKLKSLAKVRKIIK